MIVIIIIGILINVILVNSILTQEDLLRANQTYRKVFIIQCISINVKL